MSAPEKDKMDGVNTWFIIEILSFYGYILSAMIIIIRNAAFSSLGWLKKHPEEYKGDFIAKQRQNLDWAAFILILFTVNVALIMIDLYIYKGAKPESFPLRNILYLLLGNHLLQMIFHLFLKNFFGPDGKLNLDHLWVWAVLAASYSYVLYQLKFTDIVSKDLSQSSKMWIPLDILLTLGIALYQAGHYYVEKKAQRDRDEQDSGITEQLLISPSVRKDDARRRKGNRTV